jgi:hypothetical protein
MDFYAVFWVFFMDFPLHVLHVCFENYQQLISAEALTSCDLQQVVDANLVQPLEAPKGVSLPVTFHHETWRFYHEKVGFNLVIFAGNAS